VYINRPQNLSMTCGLIDVIISLRIGDFGLSAIKIDLLTPSALKPDISISEFLLRGNQSFPQNKVERPAKQFFS
jgi:hypothetical protein